MQIKIISKDFTLEYQDEVSLLDERAVSQLKNLIEFIVKETKIQSKEEQIEKKDYLVRYRPSSSNCYPKAYSDWDGSLAKTVCFDEDGNPYYLFTDCK